jgi:hypothetical protein
MRACLHDNSGVLQRGETSLLRKLGLVDRLVDYPRRRVVGGRSRR